MKCLKLQNTNPLGTNLLNLIEEIKSQITIADLLNRLGIVINSAGFINSIYKSEKSPSLKIYLKTNSYFCYATSKGGDIINFYADYYRLDKSTAIKELVNMYGITQQNKHREQPNFKAKSRPIPEVKPLQPKYTLLNDFEFELFNERAGILEYDANTDRQSAEKLAFENILNHRLEIQTKIYTAFYNYSNSKGIDEVAYNYLTGNKRGLTASTINEFCLFSIHSAKESIEFLKDTFSKDELLISGLFSRKYFVFAKHRIVIPYIENDKIVYLRGRYFYNGSSTPEKFGKYISLSNLSQTLSPKRFFNVDVLDNINPLSEITISEGEYDTMILSQHGNNCLGISGVSNFPTKQIALLKPYSVHLLFDNDKAGQIAAKKIRKEFERNDQSVKIIKLKNYKDITEMYCSKMTKEN